MKNLMFSILFLFSQLSTVYADKVLFSGIGKDVIECKDKIFDQHLYTIELRKENGNEEVYLDGISNGRCSQKSKFKSYNSYRHSFQSLRLMEKISSKDLIALFSTPLVSVGRCILDNEMQLRFIDNDGNVLPSSITKKFNDDHSGRIHKLIEELSSNNNEKEAMKSYAQDLIALVAVGKCYDVSVGESEAEEIAGLKMLAQNNLAIELFIAKDLSAISLRQLGYYPSLIKNKLGLSVDDLIAAGFSNREIIQDTGFSDNELKDMFTAEEFKLAGINSARLSRLGFSAIEVKDAGYTLNQMTDYYNGGFNDRELTSVFTIQEFMAAGRTSKSLKMIGYSAGQIKEVGFTLNQMTDYYNGGFSDSELTNVFAIQEFKDAGRTSKSLKALGYSTGQIKEVGFTLNQMTDYYNGGFSDSELTNVFAIQEFKAAGRTSKSLKALGYSAVQIKEVGFTLNQMTDYYNGGFNDRELTSVFTIQEFKAAGRTSKSLKTLGYSASQIKEAGFTLNQMTDYYNGGFSESELKGLF